MVFLVFIFFLLNNHVINSLLSQACPVAELNLKVILKEITHREKENRIGDLEQLQCNKRI